MWLDSNLLCLTPLISPFHICNHNFITKFLVLVVQLQEWMWQTQNSRKCVRQNSSNARAALVPVGSVPAQPSGNTIPCFCQYVSKSVLLLTLHLTEIIQGVHFGEYLPAAVWRVHVVKPAL